MDLRRTPTTGVLQAIVTCDDLVGCRTHFYHGRTIPCAGDDCPAHLDGIPWRWHGWISAYKPEEPAHFLFELTAMPANRIVDYRTANGTLRGCIFRARRTNNKHNGRINIQTKPADLGKIWLPEAPDLIAVLSIIWNIPLPDLHAEPVTENLRRIIHGANGCGHAVDPTIPARLFPNAS